jgi:hypothetical protein
LFFSDHFGPGLLGSAALKYWSLLSTRPRSWRLFSDHILSLFGLSAALKVLVLLSTEPRSWRLFSDHILAGLLGSAALKVRSYFPTRPKRAVVFSDHIFGRPFRALCSIKGTSPTFNRTKELEVVFSIIFWQAFSGSAALKSPVLLSTRLRAGGCFRSYLAGLLGSAALKVPVLLSWAKELEVVFRSYFGNLFRAQSIKGAQSTTPARTKELEVVFSDHIFSGPFRALQH